MPSFRIPDFHKGKGLVLFLGPVVFFMITFFADLDPNNPQVTRMAAIVAWVAIWWFTEPVDLAVTSLLPFILLPLMGISNPTETAQQYMDPIIFLFLGGFMLAFAMERWQLHTRLALGILRHTGSSPTRVLAGVMMATFILSMWVSNTATVLLLIPAVMAVIHHLHGDSDMSGRHPIAIALLLGLAYASTMGGMSTLVGTPPNMYFYSFYQQQFPEDSSINFASFFVLASTITLLMVGATYLIIRWRYLRKSTATLPRHYFKNAFKELGPVNRDQKVVLAIFTLTVVAWFTRPDMTFGETSFTGWASLMGLGGRVHDGMVAIAACLVLFSLPASTTQGRLLVWSDVQRLPFGIVLLFGSGFALATGFERSGLSQLVAENLQGLGNLHPLLLLIAIGLVITAISEFASNIACVQLVLPVMLTITADGPLPVQGILVATTLFASMGFMMPVATAPNTIIFGSGMVRTSDLVKTGFWINIIGVLLIAFIMYAWYGYG